MTGEHGIGEQGQVAGTTTDVPTVTSGAENAIITGRHGAVKLNLCVIAIVGTITGDTETREQNELVSTTTDVRMSITGVDAVTALGLQDAN